MPPRSARHRALGQAIRDIRTERGFSQEAAALHCGLDRSFFGAIERGQKNITVATLWTISDRMGTVASELMARADAIAARSRAK